MKPFGKSMRLKAGLALLVFAGFPFLNNTSLFTGRPDASPTLLAHRALGQDFDRTGLDGSTCTAERMIDGPHDFLENTIPSIAAAFEMGAEIVEIDVHLTTDGRFAVFHDWTLDCRTDGTGVTGNHTLAELQQLDIGYGYTSDGGATYPFRGRGVGMMPSLTDVLLSFPDRSFLIDIKSSDAAQGEVLGRLITSISPNRSGEILVYGGNRSVDAYRAMDPAARTISRPRLKRCLLRYILAGWSGYVPSSCANALITVPSNVAPWLWGWPVRFERRMAGVNSLVVLIGDYRGEGYSTGFNDPKLLDDIDDKFAGLIWTDRTELLAPALAARSIPQ